MKNRILLLLFAALISSVTLFAGEDYRYEDVKRFKKNYPCASNVVFEVINKYGSVNVEQWDRNEVEVNVDIIVKARSKSDVDRIMELINISFKSSQYRVTATTVLKGISISNADFSINYHVLVPRNANLELTNMYGNVVVSECNGSLISNVKYGNILIDRLNSNSVNMVSKYGNITISGGSGNEAKIDIGYGDVQIDKFKSLNIVSKYSKFKANQIGDINISSKYDNYDINSCVTVNITEGGYTKFRINNLTTSFVADDGVIRYGAVKLGGISQKIREIKFSCSYTDVSLTFREKGDYNFDLYTTYGNVKVDDVSPAKSSMRIIRDKFDNASQVVGAFSDRGSNKNTIAIRNRYGDIKIY